MIGFIIGLAFGIAGMLGLYLYQRSKFEKLARETSEEIAKVRK